MILDKDSIEAECSLYLQSFTNPFIVENINYNLKKVYLGDTLITASISAKEGVKPYTYSWSSGATTSETKYNIKNINKINLAVTVTDNVNSSIKKSVELVRDTIKRLNCLTKELPYNGGAIQLDRNPISGKIKFISKYIQDSLILKQDTSYSFDYETLYWTNFTNTSTTKNVTLYLTCSYDHPIYSIKDTTFIVTILKSPESIMSVQVDTITFCDTTPSKPFVIKARVTGGKPPYYFDWGNYGKGFGLDSLIIFPQSNYTYYDVRITDKEGQSVYKIAEVLYRKGIKFNKFMPEKHVYCGSELIDGHFIKLDMSSNIMFTNFSFNEFLFDPLTQKKYYEKGNTYIASSLNIKFYNDSIIKHKNNLLYYIYEANIIPPDKFYCISKDQKPIVDTIMILPYPKFEAYSSVADTVCEGTILNTVFPKPSSSNLNETDIIWYKFIYFHDSQGRYISDTSLTPIIDTARLFAKFVSDQYTSTNTLYEIGAKLRDKKNQCLSEFAYNKYSVFDKSKLNLYPKTIKIKSNDYASIFDSINNIRYKHNFTYLHNNLSGTLFSDKTFPLTGTVVNNSGKTEKLAIIVESSLYGCKGGSDTVFIEVKNGLIEGDVELTDSEEFNNGGKLIPLIKNKDDLGMPFEYSLQPNPTSDKLSFHFKSLRDQKSIVQIHSLNGAKLLEYPFDAFKGINSMNLDVSQLVSGQYLLSLKNDDNFLTMKFIKN